MELYSELAYPQLLPPSESTQAQRLNFLHFHSTTNSFIQSPYLNGTRDHDLPVRSQTGMSHSLTRLATENKYLVSSPIFFPPDYSIYYLYDHSSKMLNSATSLCIQPNKNSNHSNMTPKTCHLFPLYLGSILTSSFFLYSFRKLKLYPPLSILCPLIFNNTE